ncbi:MAG: response regulator transcription factor, partial [Chloroflexi bacterium]|nr:response regulator transcription factor [Chloroflexota bacterium]
MTVRVLLADDHGIVREGLRLVLDAQPNIEVVGEAEDGRRALELVRELQPDVVVMDIAMPNLNGLEATRQIRRQFPAVRVVILTMHENELYFLQIAKAGATGCVLKRSMGRELVAAVEAAARGESYFSPAIATKVLEDYRRLAARPTGDDIDVLTEREREILQLVAEGQTNREIAELLTLSIKTVQAHRANI